MPSNPLGRGSRVPTTPPYTPPASPPNLGVPPASVVNSVAQKPEAITATVNAAFSPIAVHYGKRTAGARIFARCIYQGKLVLGCAWGRGPIDSIEEVLIDDKAKPAAVTVTNYIGAQVAADPTLVAAFAAQTPSRVYADVLPGRAYSVVVIPPGLTKGFPRITAVLKGLKMHEPRCVPKLKWKGESTLVPEVGPAATSMTRNLAAHFKDWQGLQRLVPAHCARFTGARFVQNLITGSSEDLTSGTHPNDLNVTVTATTITFNSANNSRFTKQCRAVGSTPANEPTVWRMEMSCTVARTVCIRIVSSGGGSGAVFNNVAVDSTPRVYSLSTQFTLIGNHQIHINNISGGEGATDTSTSGVLTVKFLQAEEATGQLNPNPSEYVPMGVAGAAFPYRGAGVDGCEFFDHPNGNIVDHITGIVTQAVGVDAERHWLELNGGSAGKATTPDSAAVSVTGDLTLKAYIAPWRWAPGIGNIRALIYKWDGPPLLSYAFSINADGTFNLNWSNDGTTSNLAASTAPFIRGNGAAFWVKVTLDVDNGAAGRSIRFWWSADNVVWTQIGATVTQAGVTSVFNGTTSVHVGIHADATNFRYGGKILRAQICDGIDGPVVADFNPALAAEGAGSFVAATGETWTIVAPAKIYARSFGPLRRYRKERSAENVILRSREIENAAWSKGAGPVVVTANQAVAPDGTFTADLLTLTAGGGLHHVYQAFAATAVPWTNAFSLRAGTVSWAALSFDDDARTHGAFFNLATGTVGTVAAGVTATIEREEFGFWRCVITKTPTAGTHYNVLEIHTADNQDRGFAAAGTETIYAVDAQTELGSAASSPIVTTTTAVTRPRDQLVFPIGVHSDVAGSAYAEYEVDVNQLTRIIGDSADGSGAPIGFYTIQSGITSWDGTNQADGPAGAPVGVIKGASVWGAGTKQSFASGVGGAAGSYDGSFNLTAIAIGNGGGADYEGHIGAVEIYDRKFSSAAIAQFPTPNNWAILEPANDPQIAWSDNPALCLADFLESSVYGAAKRVNWTTVGDAAAHCDELIGSPAEKRRTLSLSLERPAPINAWTEALRAYTSCFIADLNGKKCLIPDKPRATAAFAFDSATNCSLMGLRKRGRMNVPTVVTVRYTDTSKQPWREDWVQAMATGVQAGTTPYRESTLRLEGVSRRTQASREAYERLNKLALRDLSADLRVNDEGLKPTHGDVVPVTHDVGLAGKLMLIISLAIDSAGRWIAKLLEYDPAVYSDDTPATPSVVDTTMPSPFEPPAPLAVALLEEVFQFQSFGQYGSRLKITVTPPADWPFTAGYDVELLDGTDLVYSNRIPASAAPVDRSGALKEGRTYTARAYLVSSTGTRSSAVTASLITQGKNLAPGDVPAFTRAQEIGGTVYLAWAAAIDIDIVRYPLKYGDPGAFNWATATLIDVVDGLTAQVRGIAPGTWRFAVKARDSVTPVPNESANHTFVDLVVTSDADAFLQDRQFTNPTLTAMVAFKNEGDPNQKWITNHADQWDTLFPLAMTNYPNPVATYHTAGASRFVGESWDLGAVVTGDFVLEADVTDLSGAHTKAIEHSPDGSAWTPEAGTSWKGADRFFRPFIETTGAGSMQINKPPKLKLSAITKKEFGGPVTSSATLATTINLSGKYVKAVDINVQSIGTTPRIGSYDNVVLSLSGANTFDVYLLDAAGNQVASDFTWTFEGY